MKKMAQFIATALLACMIFSVAGCSAPKNETDDYSQQETVVGVAVYNTEDPEVLAFRNYFKNYLANCFHVSFLYSDSIRSAEDEQAFVNRPHKPECRELFPLSLMIWKIRWLCVKKNRFII